MTNAMVIHYKLQYTTLHTCLIEALHNDIGYCKYGEMVKSIQAKYYHNIALQFVSHIIKP